MLEVLQAMDTSSSSLARPADCKGVAAAYLVLREDQGSSPTPTPTPLAGDVGFWREAGGEKDVSGLQSGLDKIDAAGSSGDLGALVSACSALQLTAQDAAQLPNAQAELPPGPAHDDWNRAVVDALSAAVACLPPADSQQTLPSYAAAKPKLDVARSQLNVAAAEIGRLK